ncbi:MAG: tRNA (adenosine(37)-N6)-threonylcarbamoyltransferase complex transferase subunit TsaD [Deltaproteobacteria bacterium]|nr:tRNA (adenosine(37)-N6)-threonylcarbamoyltransferase complex transferase subunit TsaD [Candidatus Zymogenaceae bacterium]
MYILGIDTSCDDTSAAVVTDDLTIKSNIVSSQHEIHGKFGGVVPELASRRHLENIIPVIDHALRTADVSIDEIDLIAVTRGPGLVGSLVVGVSAAKAICEARGIPIIGVNHIEGHITSSLMTEHPLEFPFVCLVVSGGHTNLYLAESTGTYRLVGRTRDDAAGEAFDKVAKLLNLGYPGGRPIEEKAREYTGETLSFPRAYLEKDSFDFSFSGVKTAVRNYIKKKARISDIDVARIAHGFQEAVVEVLVDKTIRLAEEHGVDAVTLTGGVAANGRLREEMEKQAVRNGMRVVAPPIKLCTDNAAMIAAVGVLRRAEAKEHDLFMNAISRWKL